MKTASNNSLNNDTSKFVSLVSYARDRGLFYHARGHGAPNQRPNIYNTYHTKNLLYAGMKRSASIFTVLTVRATWLRTNCLVPHISDLLLLCTPLPIVCPR